MDRFTEYLEDVDKFVRWPTLIIGFFLLLTTIIAIEAARSGKGYAFLRIGVYSVLLLGWLGTWYFLRSKLPRNKPNKIGVLISLRTENDKEKSRLKNDLVKRLRELIHTNRLSEEIEVIFANNHQAERLEPLFVEVAAELVKPYEKRNPNVIKRWAKIGGKMGCHFHVYGSIKERQRGRNTYVIDTNMMVSHAPLDTEARQQIARDVTNVWGSQFTFAETVEYHGFNFAAEYIYVAAKYIIGCAAFASGDAVTAIKLHESLINELGTLAANPNITYIEHRLSQLLAAEHHIIAFWAYSLENNFRKAKTHVERCLNYDTNHYGGHLTKAIVEFSHEHNPRKALDTIERARKLAPETENGWLYSKGFLLLNLERFQDAVTVYRELTEYHVDLEEVTVEQVVMFNKNILRVQPNYIQSLFILGYLSLIKVPNYPVALEYFETFLRKAKHKRKFAPLIAEAERYKLLAEKEMGLKG